MATLKEALKELYDGFVEENSTPPVTGRAGMTRSQNDAAQLYAAAVSRAAGTAGTQKSTQPPAQQTMASRLVITPDVRQDTSIGSAPSKKAARPDVLSVLDNLTPDKVIQGIVLSEILGKPVSRRSGSNRIGR